jgi:chromatin assembly factor 1 subunit A
MAESLNRKRPAPDNDNRPSSEKLLNLKGNQFMMPSPPDTEEEKSSNTSRDGRLERERAVSPAKSDSTLSSAPENDAAVVASTANASSVKSDSASGAPPAKRRKLTPNEKLEQAQLKEAKAREKAEEKARKAEEKRVKDEEKRQKAEEREAKKRERELEEERKRQEKQEKEEQKIAEKLKKERSQMRLGAFFQKPTTPAKSTPEGDEGQRRIRRKSLSLEPFDAVSDQIKSSASPSKGSPAPASKKVAAVSDYHRTFLPFVLPTHSTLAPAYSPADADEARFDHEISDPAVQEKYDLGLVDSYAALGSYFGKSVRRGRGHPNVKRIIDRIQGTTSTQPIDLTDEDSGDNPMDVLRKIPTRHIQFDQDVRPAYYGSYTKIRSPRTIRRTMKNPFTKSRPDTDYDIDSEAEWEEPEEGDEELDSDGEDEAESNADEEELEDFLDDDDDKARAKRQVITSELAPESTGLCFADTTGRKCVVEGVPGQRQPDVFSGMRMGFLLPAIAGTTIDPFSTEYWEVKATVTSSLPLTGPLGAQATSSEAMPPPRAPLQPKLSFGGNSTLDLVGAAEGEKGPITTSAATQGAKRGPKSAPKTLSKVELDEFKEAVIGSPLGRLDLQKGLKTR